jgi:hypothetical protein
MAVEAVDGGRLVKRSAMKPRQTPMARGNGLARSSLARGTGLRPVSARTAAELVPAPRAMPGAMKAAVTLVLAGQATVAQAARECSVDPGRLDARAWTEVKAVVMERDNWTCQASGNRAVDVHHRVRRGIGGTDNPVIAFGTVNLVALSRAAHDRCHAEDQEMRDRGFQLRTTQDPAAVPVRVAAEYGEELRWLLAGGGVSLNCPLEVAA